MRWFYIYDRTNVQRTEWMNLKLEIRCRMGISSLELFMTHLFGSFIRFLFCGDVISSFCSIGCYWKFGCEIPEWEWAMAITRSALLNDVVGRRWYYILYAWDRDLIYCFYFAIISRPLTIADGFPTEISARNAKKETENERRTWSVQS